MRKYIAAAVLLGIALPPACAQQKTTRPQERTVQPVQITADNDPPLTVMSAPDTVPTNHRFTAVEQMPEFPGGSPALTAYLKSNLVYPPAARENSVEGRVFVRFVVEDNGVVTDVEVIRKLDPDCDQEAIRLVKQMPKWTPGRQNGRAVAVYYNLPVSFSLKKD